MNSILSDDEAINGRLGPVTYGSWNFDMSRAPKGRVVKATRLVTDTKTGEKVPTVYDSYETDHVIIASKCGKVTRSYWLPDEERWCMLSHKNEPLAWMAWPEHPFTAAPGDAAVTPGNDLRKPVAAEQGQIIREGDAPRETDRANGVASSPDTHQPEVANETMGGTGDDCSFGNRGVWPPQEGASSSLGNDSLSVVTAGETAPQHPVSDLGLNIVTKHSEVAGT